MESEPGIFECDTCEFRERVDGLDAENAEGWRCYAKLTSHRWVFDLQAVDWWLGRVFDGLDEDEREDLMARVDVIYDALHPPKGKT